MIRIGIDPILFNLGSLSLSWHSLFMVVAIGIGVWLPARLVAKAGLSVDRLYSIALWGVPGGIIGARLVHVIDYWSRYMANPGNIFAFCSWSHSMRSMSRKVPFAANCRCNVCAPAP